MLYDVIVIGGGHAGAEAAALASRAGARTLLLTQRLETIGQMSCNPAIGGIAKGTVVREVDALGGVMGRATDLSRIQFRMLNRSKGPAVWSPRAQCDRGLYRASVQLLLERLPRLVIREGTVREVCLHGDQVAGAVTSDGTTYRARAVVVTAGTFLRGMIHVGRSDRTPAGRAGDAPSMELSQALESQGLTTERFKTGTPPRIHGGSVRFEALTRQDGEGEPYWFSHYDSPAHPEQRPCWITHTGTGLREIIESHLHESALYGGAISGRGPRYCPSIEDKIVRFREAPRHQVFLEPEGLDTEEMYVNGLSTSLPAGVQEAFLRTIAGLESVVMTRPGYAIEYDYFPPTQLDHTLGVKGLRGLFFAGQVNGTTGYEEAAGQGVVAGLNAAAHALGTAPVRFLRDGSYIGVMVDDLVTRGVDEPYRLFTSRAEYRLTLRQDNALRRLLPVAIDRGLLSDEERRVAERRLSEEDRALAVAHELTGSPEQVNPVLVRHGERPIQEGARLSGLARRPRVPLAALLSAVGAEEFNGHAGWADVELKYDGYIAREAAQADRARQMEGFALPAELEYQALETLSWEAREKLDRVRPTTLGQAGRIPGVTPSDLQNLVLEALKRR